MRKTEANSAKMIAANDLGWLENILSLCDALAKLDSSGLDFGVTF
jgi:hypothetical protein